MYWRTSKSRLRKAGIHVWKDDKLGWCIATSKNTMPKHDAPTKSKPEKNSRAWRAAAKLQLCADQIAAKNPYYAPPLPEGVELRPYQMQGVSAILRRLGYLPNTTRPPNDVPQGILLGDEMGLGKTPQAIAVCNWLGEKALPLLIVCPNNVKLVWRDEWPRWSVSGLPIMTLPGKITAAHLRAAAEAPVIIVNYDKFSRKSAFLEILESRNWATLILDECHYIKERTSKRSKSIMALKAQITLALTGTPMVNRPAELWTQTEKLAPGFLGLFPDYALRYCNAWYEQIPVAGNRTRKILVGHDGTSNLVELGNRLRASVMIRRHKRDVLTELPPKQRQLLCMEPPPHLKNMLETAKKNIENKGYSWENIEEMLAGSIESAVSRLSLPTEMAEHLSIIRHDLGVAKVQPAVELIRDTVAASGKITVFAYHRDVVEGLYGSLSELNPVRIYGGSQESERELAITRFQNDPACKVFIGSIGASREGITLTAASDLLFVETDWVPGNILQAEDRCHRIGQNSAVQVRWMVWDSTLDVLIARKVMKKLEHIESVTGISL